MSFIIQHLHLQLEQKHDELTTKNILEEIKYSLKAVKLDKYLNGKYETPIIINYDDELKLKGKIDIYSQEYGIIDLKTIATTLNVNGNDYYRWKIKEYLLMKEH